jgi:hypothetical protein
MRTLIYKRTHKGDPDKMGCFGIWDCMGRLRNMAFDAVIGVGGTGAQPEAQGISYKINWIGVGAHKTKPNATMFPAWRGPFVTFDHFVLFENKGVDFWCVAPILARRMYAAKGPRFLLLLTHQGAHPDSFQACNHFLHLVRSGGRPWAGPKFRSRVAVGAIPTDFSWNFNPDTNEWESVRRMAEGSDDAVEFSSPSKTVAEDPLRDLIEKDFPGLLAQGGGWAGLQKGTPGSRLCVGPCHSPL